MLAVADSGTTPEVVAVAGAITTGSGTGTTGGSVGPSGSIVGGEIGGAGAAWAAAYCWTWPAKAAS